MKIIVKPRIHVTLISMHNSGYRVNGGIGFAINEPKGMLTFTLSEKFEITDARQFPLNKNEANQLIMSLKNVRDQLKLSYAIKTEIKGDILTHYGMGSGTSLRLACIEGLLKLNGHQYNSHELVKLSGRGGTSGVGINTYFKGGFIFDLGVINNNKKLQPSSSAVNPSIPMVANTMRMPNWKIGLCLPTSVRSKSQLDEIEFFKRTCPIKAAEVYKTLYQCLFGVYSAIRENDLDTFTNAIKEIQKCEWKKKERAEHGKGLENIEKNLYRYGARCVGMSSLGPLLYFFADQDGFENITHNMQDKECRLIFTSMANTGRSISQ